MKRLIFGACILIPLVGLSQSYSIHGDTKLAISTEVFIQEMMVPSESVQKGFSLMDRMGARTSQTLPREIQMRRFLAETIFSSNKPYTLSRVQLENIANKMIKNRSQVDISKNTIYADPSTGIKIELTSFHTAASMKVVLSRFAEGAQRFTNNDQVKTDLFNNTRELAKEIASSLQEQTKSQRTATVVLDRLYHNDSKVEVFRDTTVSGQELTVNKAKIELFIQAANFDKASPKVVLESLMRNLQKLIKTTQFATEHISSVKKHKQFESNRTNRLVQESLKRQGSASERAIKKGAKK